MASEIITGISSSSELERKMHLKGTIIKTNKAGAIVEIGVEKPALLHVSQITVQNDQPVLRVEDVLATGQEIDVYIKNIRDDRIEVTMKEPLSLEWREINKDMVVKGKVTQIEKFGVFVDIGAERPGLIHVSELTYGYVREASEVVSIGDEVEAKIIDFNRRRKQIKLSMKAMQPGLDEIEGVKITPARPNRRDKKSKTNKETRVENNETPVENEPTFMEIALREAMEKA
ncbi:MAG: S1 RNA-binding domain-containing protein, partial [Pelolinea sp.]|nr:S1 RNA-binding domain-containing protein [Pelolinea sp.]